MFSGPIKGKRYVDVTENAGYWYFVVLVFGLAIFAAWLGEAERRRHLLEGLQPRQSPRA